MNAARDDGGPAFPAQPITHLDGGISITTHQGMSLRDYFAGLAMQGMLSAEDEERGGLCVAGPTARRAYAFADAMLAARAGAPEGGA